MIDDDLFCADLSIFLDMIERSKAVQRPSYFELLIVFILWEFVRYEVDYAVLETGLEFVAFFNDFLLKDGLIRIVKKLSCTAEEAEKLVRKHFHIC